ncbi:hypothetical protein KO494_02995 [Lacinutrix sp. C3R15]|uniref:hypothetical protein n=1 Tax=Flavobacteriaceae TaxID=49546 RepID=UPI001C09CF7F|nr:MULTISPECIES: hypothetical protein [Flavobacteriaceae]MBU2938497.1 hypothetical protein [Lacinutrix sp. C3R15]MDO6621811.1 hypothetical protein [Oceanihabitans sp. 1_MG-2023]
MKITGLHALSHTDANEDAIDCTICDHAILHNVTPLQTPDFNFLEIKNNEPVLQREITLNNKCVIYKYSTSSKLFSRPPPFLL